ncbi:hypothetical protein ULO1_27940, partial [Carboxydocella sp. ULO1]
MQGGDKSMFRTGLALLLGLTLLVGAAGCGSKA